MRPVLVSDRTSTGRTSDQYWSQEPLNTGSAEAAVRVYTICMGIAYKDQRPCCGRSTFLDAMKTPPLRCLRVEDGGVKWEGFRKFHGKSELLS